MSTASSIDQLSADWAASNYPSTAPTTPDGSLTFSPILRASDSIDTFGSAMAHGTESEHRSAFFDLNAASSESVRNICCIGAGYVGGPTSAVIAFQNPQIRVNVVDRDRARIASWKSKHLPIHEDGLSDIVRIARDGSKSTSFHNGLSNLETMSFSDSESDENREDIFVPARRPNLFFTTEVSRCIAEADIILVTVNTPTKLKGIGAGKATDVTALEVVTKEIAMHARPGTILVEKSTVPCGTSELMRATLAIHRPGVSFEILSNPEFLAEGTAIKDLMHPDRVVIGSANTPSGRRAAETLANVYAAWMPRARITTINVWSSELSKLVANAMLAQRISSINSISAICEKTGANINEVALSIGLDPRIGAKYLKSSLGFGGSCFKKDILSLIYLAEGLGLDEVAGYWQQVLTLNDYQRDRFSQRIITKLNNTLVRKKITLLGYAFKKNTSDTRETPALDVVRTLLKEIPGEIAIFDPCCSPATIKKELQQFLGSATHRILSEEGGPVQVHTDVYSACQDSNAIVIVTEWDQFRNTATASCKADSKHPNPTSKIKTWTKSTPVDPRPFQSISPTEMDLAALNHYLVSTSTGSITPPSDDQNDTNNKQSYGTSSLANDVSDPLGRYRAEPVCEEPCEECAREGGEGSFDNKAGEQLDWDRVVEGLESPKWVFDGRGILDVPRLESLGVRVETIGLSSLS